MQAKKHREFLQLFIDTRIAGTFIPSTFRTETLTRVIQEDQPLEIMIVDGRRWLVWSSK